MSLHEVHKWAAKIFDFFEFELTCFHGSQLLRVFELGLLLVNRICFPPTRVATSKNTPSQRPSYLPHHCNQHLRNSIIYEKRILRFTDKMEQITERTDFKPE